MGKKSDVWQGTLALMVLKTLETLGPMHGYGMARRIEQTSGDRLLLNYGTLYPALLKLEQEGYIAVGVGRLGEQSQGQVLQADAGGSRAAETGSAGVEGDGRHHRAIFDAGEGGVMRKLRAALVRLGGWWGREGARAGTARGAGGAFPDARGGQSARGDERGGGAPGGGAAIRQRGVGQGIACAAGGRWGSWRPRGRTWCTRCAVCGAIRRSR